MNLRLIVTLSCAAACAACGSSNNTSDAAAGSSSEAGVNAAMYDSASASSVGVLMTDAPANLGLLASVNVTLDKVQVHVVPKGSVGGAFDPNQGAGSAAASADDGAGQDANAAFHTDPNDTSIDDDAYWQTITLANSNFNLLALQGNITAVVGGLDVPTGVLTQIRLFIDPNGVNNVVLASASVCPLDVSRIGQKGLKIDDNFPHTPLHDGNTTTFTVDFDLANSLSQDGDCAFSLHPVFHLRGHDVAHRPDGGWSGQHPEDPNGKGSVSGSGEASASASGGSASASASSTIDAHSDTAAVHHTVGRGARPQNAPMQ